MTEKKLCLIQTLLLYIFFLHYLYFKNHLLLLNLQYELFNIIFIDNFKLKILATI